jgi:hypothetical protein
VKAGQVVIIVAYVAFLAGCAYLLKSHLQRVETQAAHAAHMANGMVGVPTMNGSPTHLAEVKEQP